LSISALAVPAILAVPLPKQTLALQWRFAFQRGMVTMPGTAVLSLLAFASLAYERNVRGQPWKGFATAGALTIAIVPFTLVLMSGTNKTLLSVAAGGAATLDDAAVRRLVTRWSAFNLVRSLLPLAGSLVGFWTLLAG
jgi:hypothetical protein